MDHNKKLDFLSDQFDPTAVLESDINKIKIPIPDAKVFNNLDEYALKSFPSKKIEDNKNKDQTDLDLLRKQREIRERMKEKIELLNNKKNRRDKDIKETVLTLMFKSTNDQLNLINYLNKRIRIFIRRRRKSNYSCEQYACIFGQLMFYDKHWNLILSDVNETIQFIDDKQINNQLNEKSIDQSNNKLNDRLNKKLDDKLNKESNKQLNEQLNEQFEFINKQKLNELNKTESFISKKMIKNDQLSLSTSNLISSIDNRRLLIKKDDKSLFKISIRERYFKRLFIRGDNIIYISKL